MIVFLLFKHHKSVPSLEEIFNILNADERFLAEFLNVF